MTFEEGVALLFHKLGDSKIMALGSSVNDYVMVRNVSCLFYDGKIYFKTDKNFRKTQQLYRNPQVALCTGGVQVEGIAVNKGLVVTSREEGLKPCIRNICGRAIMHTAMRIRRF